MSAASVLIDGATIVLAATSMSAATRMIHKKYPGRKVGKIKMIKKKIKKKKAEEVNRNRKSWYLTASKKNAIKYAGARKSVYRLPNGMYVVRKTKRKSKKRRK